MLVLCGAGIAVAACGTVAPPTATLHPGSEGAVRHARSTIIALVNYGTPGAALWAYRTSAREIWLAPDGSGRIEEITTSLDLVDPYTQQDWVAAGNPDTGDMAEDFAPGGLSYVSRSDARGGIDRVAAGGLAPGDALRLLASFLAETAPDSSTVARAIDVARRIPGVATESTGDRLSFYGDTDGDKVRVTLEFDAAQLRLVSETWRSMREISGINLATPYLLFSRSSDLEEELPAWSPLRPSDPLT